MIINDEFRQEFANLLEGYRKSSPKQFDDDGNPWCDLHGAGMWEAEWCGRAAVALLWDPQDMIFLCVNHALGLHQYAKELAADAEVIRKQLKEQPNPFIDEDGVEWYYTPDNDE